MIRSLGRMLCRHRRNPLIRRINKSIVALHKATENLSYDVRLNGELWVLQRVASSARISTVFDVGANKGDWSKVALQTFPTSEIHAFEVVPATFMELERSVGHEEAMTLNSCGLSNREGTLAMHVDPRFPVLATSVPGFSQRFHGYDPATAQLPVTTGDAYCVKKGIEHIGFLKIDVEGHEPNVLKGFEGMLGRGSIDIIQFEYGYINIDTGFLLKHFHEYLEAFDMRVGKIFPNHVEFREYRHLHEDFYGPNFLAVHSNLSNVIRELAGR
jgi:FkbM family methyltransferase